MFKLPNLDSDFKSVTDLVRTIAKINGFDNDAINTMNLDLIFNLSDLNLKVKDGNIYLYSRYNNIFIKRLFGFKDIIICTGYYYHNIYGTTFHNEYGSAYVCIKINNDDNNYLFNNNYLYELVYFIGGKRHNFLKPAVKMFLKNGLCFYECYYLHNKVHNSVGPAIVEYFIDNYRQRKLYNVKFCIDGKLLKKEDFINKLERRL